MNGVRSRGNSKLKRGEEKEGGKHEFNERERGW